MYDFKRKKLIQEFLFLLSCYRDVAKPKMVIKA